jgi:hypothetical protein
VLCVAGVSHGREAAPDRIDHLIRILETGPSFKVRLLAIAYLGKSRDSRAVPALARMIADRNRAVRRLAVASLAQIGDRGALQALRTISLRADDLGLRARRAIREIERRQAQKSKSPRVYLTVGKIANHAGRDGHKLARLFRESLLSAVSEEPGVTTSAAGAARGYVLDGAIVDVRQTRSASGLRLVCRVRVSVATLPDNSMKAFYEGQADAVAPGSEPVDALYRDLLEGAAREATRQILQEYILDENRRPLRAAAL